MRFNAKKNVRDALACIFLLVGSIGACVPPASETGPIVAGGASFSEPKGWSRGTPSKPKTKGYFLSPDSNPRVALNAIIMIDIGEPSEGSLQATAEKTARDWGGKLLDEKTTLDGAEALRVRVENPGPGLRPLEGVLAMKGGKLYMLMGGAVPGRSVIEPVEEVRKGWKWVD